jgi:predicted hydrocarbon binding protein
MEDLLKSLSFNSGAGDLRVGSLRHILVRPETLSEIQKGVEDRLGVKSSEYLYAAGASWGMAVCRRMKAENAGSAGDLVQAIGQHATELGWGCWKIETFKPEARLLVVRVAGSPLAEAYGTSDVPVCHLLAGAVSGVLEFLLGMPVGCVEQKCRVQGSSECLFVATGIDLAGKDAWEW